MNSTTVLELTTNARFLAAFRVAVGLIAVTKGTLLLLGGATPAAVLPWIALSICVTVGWMARWAALGMVILGVYLIGAYYRNHLYLLWLLVTLVAMSDCERDFALRKRGRGPVPGWPVVLMRVQVSVVYFYAGLAKLNPDFVKGDILEYYFDRSVFALPDLSVALIPISLSVVAIELIMSMAVWSRTLRPLAFGLAIPIHLGMVGVAQSPMVVFEIGAFGLLTFLLLHAFLDLPERGRLVIWDDTCSFCKRWTMLFRRLDCFGALQFADASSPAEYAATGVEPQAAMEAMHVVEPDGTVRRGFDAVQAIIYILPGGLLVAPWMGLPGIRHAGHRLYARVAARRTCNVRTASFPRPASTGVATASQHDD